MKVLIIGRSRPFWGGKLRKIGEIVDVPTELYNDEKKRSQWMGKPSRRTKKPVETHEDESVEQDIPNVV